MFSRCRSQRQPTRARARERHTRAFDGVSRRAPRTCALAHRPPASRATRARKPPSLAPGATRASSNRSFKPTRHRSSPHPRCPRSRRCKARRSSVDYSWALLWRCTRSRSTSETKTSRRGSARWRRATKTRMSSALEARRNGRLRANAVGDSAKRAEVRRKTNVTDIPIASNVKREVKLPKRGARYGGGETGGRSARRRRSAMVWDRWRGRTARR